MVPFAVLLSQNGFFTDKGEHWAVMLLRHNWVRLGFPERGYNVSKDLSRWFIRCVFPPTHFQREIYSNIFKKKKVRRETVDGMCGGRRQGCVVRADSPLTTAVIRERWTFAMRARACCCTPALPYKVIRNLREPRWSLSGWKITLRSVARALRLGTKTDVSL